MSNMYLQPASCVEARRNYFDTIEPGRSLDDIISHISNDNPDRERLMTLLPKKYESSRITIWGYTYNQKKEKYWKEFSAGDYMLFYIQGKYVSSLRLNGIKTQDESLAKYLWGRNREGETWEFIFFLEDFQKLNIPIEKLNERIGYSPSFILRGVTKVRLSIVRDVRKIIQSLKDADYKNY